MSRKIITGRSCVIAEAATLMLMTAIASHTAMQIQAAPTVPRRTTANLEHVVIAVRDLAVATTTYEHLGFTVMPGGRHPSGGTTGNGVFFSNGTYLELLTFYDREKAADLAKFLEEREGPRSIAVEVSSAVEIRDALHAAGIEGTEPTKGKWESSSPVTKEWLTIDPKPALPGNIFFIDYLKASQSHPNTATGIRSVWVMVKTLEETTRTFERLGFSVGEQIQAPRFGAVVQEVTLGKASLVLMMAKEKRPESHADEDTTGSGIVRLSIMVQNLEATRAVIKAHSGQTLEVYKGIYGSSVSIPANLTHGIAIEFVQNAR
jgi:catechol 2,3-dioxygenase-like lactoylglutathione lyase family enzyme/predicted lactoylglutathione lyase